MQKNAEQTGSIFGTIPSEMMGNVKCISNPEIYAIGYVDASITSTSEIYLSSDNYDKNLLPVNIEKCTSDSSTGFLVNPDVVPYGYLLHSIVPVSFTDFDYYYIRRSCVDCTMISGSKKRPKNWPTNHY